jgi:hypothetical protein
MDDGKRRAVSAMQQDAVLEGVNERGLASPRVVRGCAAGARAQRAMEFFGQGEPHKEGASARTERLDRRPERTIGRPQSPSHVRRQPCRKILVERFQNSNHMRPSKRQHFADQDAKLQRISFMESMV